MLKKSGCYMITHTPTGRFYIGSALVLRTRLYGHRSSIRNGKHVNANMRALGRNVNDFSFAVLLVCAAQDRKMYEDRLLTLYQSFPGFLNRQLAGHVPTDAARKKMSEARVGKKRAPFSAEWRERLGAVTRGKARSPEYCARMRIWLKGRVFSPEAKARVLAAHLGKKRSATTCENISAAKRARPKPTHCGKGHEFTVANTYTSSTRQGRIRIKRRCRECDRIRDGNRQRDWSRGGVSKKAALA